ncbi:MAG: hypothetical protein R3D85_06670 [Paracoccaceae bacterium]
MNVDRIINMFLRMVMRKGIDMGARRLAGGGKGEGERTKAERQQARSAKQGLKQARQGMRLARRIGKF